MTNEKLQDIIYEVEVFKQKSVKDARHSIDNKLAEYKEKIPEKVDNTDFELKVQKEIDKKLSTFSKELDIKPAALYYSLKSDVELDNNISKKELLVSAYDFLEEHTKNKLLRRIFKELKKETKNV